MKKYTNKILLITALVLALLIIIEVTVDFQISYKKDPEHFIIDKKKVSTVITSKDSIGNTIIIYKDEEGNIISDTIHD